MLRAIGRILALRILEIRTNLNHFFIGPFSLKWVLWIRGSVKNCSNDAQTGIKFVSMLHKAFHSLYVTLIS